MTQEAYGNSRFYVKIDGITTAVFSEVSGLQVETTVMDYEEGGNNSFVHRLPGRTKVSNLTLKRGITKGNEFFKWYSEVVRGAITRKNLTVIMYDTEGIELIHWDFIEAYPVKWVGPQFSADGKTMAVETLELAHRGLQQLTLK
jgi:phage tail-like protein